VRQSRFELNLLSLAAMMLAMHLRYVANKIAGIQSRVGPEPHELFEALRPLRPELNRITL